MEMALSRLRGPVKEISKSHAPSFLRARFLSSSSSSSRSLSRYTLSLSLSLEIYFLFILDGLDWWNVVEDYCIWSNLLLMWICYWFVESVVYSVESFEFDLQQQLANFIFILMFCKFYLVNFCAGASFGID